MEHVFSPLPEKAVILIPARYESQRFPGKPLAMLRGATGAAKPLIQRTWEAAAAGGMADSVCVLTDDPRIRETAEAFGARVLMTPPSCRNGTERCSAALAALPDKDIIVNAQGDSPLTPGGLACRLARYLADHPEADVVSAAFIAPDSVRSRLIADAEEGRVGGTSVVLDAAGRAMYFSKRLLPFGVESDPSLALRLHLGIYAYRRSALAAYPDLPIPPMEGAEGLEQLRFLNAGTRIDVLDIEPQDDFWEVNNPDDVPLVEAALKVRGIS
jgi:3-deoxy-manno-octulosonate cytidylyltransferase (CMP-KDO synthetase)|tara:strand:- start:53396 stop:54208 length:813 start_codon:yes stop_codon:yes gene_type:complete